MSQELIPLPRAEQPHVKIDPLMQVDLERITDDAAFGYGKAPRSNEVNIHNNFLTQDKSANPIFYGGMGQPITEDLRRTYTNYETTVSNETSEGTAKLSAGDEKDYVESKYPVRDSKELTLDNNLQSGKKIKTRIEMLYAKDGRRYKGTPTETRVVSHPDGLIEVKYSKKPMTERRIKAAKRLATYAFGLKYAAPKPHDLFQDKDKQFSVNPTIEAEVKSAVFGLEAKGLKGAKLKKALLAQYHPDANGGDRDKEEAFKYIESLAI